ncbi:MAG: hypothetical protein ABR526_10015 [Chthoniobacterales bacterium]
MLIATLGYGKEQISNDRDLTALDLSTWDCLEKPEGSGETADGVERNKQKNRAPFDLAGVEVLNFDIPGFVRYFSAFDAEANGKHRQDLSSAQREQLNALEKRVVSLTAYLGMAYSGAPETTNCGHGDIHDWHLEMFERPIEHAPTIGDATPIICEITPRTQDVIYKAGIRLQKLSGFFRRSDLETEPMAQKPQLVRITGLLMWDDAHIGKADIGPTIESITPNKYHHPWRLTGWEIHPVFKIEVLPDPGH